jgi:hypothetical protein
VRGCFYQLQSTGILASRCSSHSLRLCNPNRGGPRRQGSSQQQRIAKFSFFRAYFHNHNHSAQQVQKCKRLPNLHPHNVERFQKYVILHQLKFSLTKFLKVSKFTASRPLLAKAPAKKAFPRLMGQCPGQGSMRVAGMASTLSAE